MKKKLQLLLAVPALFLVVVLVIAVLRARSDPASGHSMTDEAGASGGSSSKAMSSATGPDTSASALTADGSVARQTGATAAPMGRAIVATGQVTLRPTSINRARAEVMRLVASWGGSVADEKSSSDRSGRMVDSTLTLRVPTAKFSSAMQAFSGLGKVRQQSRQSEDVTTQVIDNDARVRAAERSIRQIEALLDRAEDLSDIIKIESDLARRQADLDSLRSQQAYLRDQTSLSTINVYLSRSAHVGRQEEARGFLAGLDDGWTAMKDATVVLLTGVGAVLPFGVVLALFGVPLWLVLRRRFGARPVSSGTAPARSA